MLFYAHAGVVLAIAHFGVATGPIEELPIVPDMACGLLLLGVQKRLGLLEIVVVGGEVAAGNVFGKCPAVDEVLVVHMGGAVARVVRDGGGPHLQRAVRADVVGQHQLVAAVVVLEIVIRPLQLHEARDKIEIGLAVLHHVVPGAVVPGQPVLDGETIGPEHFLDDVRHLLELEDLEVRAARGVPEPRAQNCLEQAEVPVASDVRELRDLAGEIAFVTAVNLGGQVHLDRHVVAKQRFGRNRRVLTQQSHAVFKEAGNLLAALERAELQFVTQWIVDDEGAISHENSIPTNLLIAFANAISQTDMPQYERQKKDADSLQTLLNPLFFKEFSKQVNRAWRLFCAPFDSVGCGFQHRKDDSVEHGEQFLLRDKIHVLACQRVDAVAG